MPSTIEQILNIGVPILLIIIVLGFLWVKFFEPYIVPIFVKLINNIRERNQNAEHKRNKEILYE